MIPKQGFGLCRYKGRGLGGHTHSPVTCWVDCSFQCNTEDDKEKSAAPIRVPREKEKRCWWSRRGGERHRVRKEKIMVLAVRVDAEPNRERGEGKHQWDKQVSRDTREGYTQGGEREREREGMLERWWPQVTLRNRSHDAGRKIHTLISHLKSHQNYGVIVQPSNCTHYFTDKRTGKQL